MTGALEREATVRQQFSSGRELINAVKARREHAQVFAALAADLRISLARRSLATSLACSS